MAENHTLLADLIPRFTGRIEDAAVEALGYILNKSPASLAALNRLVQAGNAHMAEIEMVRTQSVQASDREQTRPDLVGFDKSGTERVLIEAKFWAGLTDHQPKGYLNRLPQDGPAVLLFVAPGARLETLWRTLRGRVEDLLGRDEGDGSVFSASLNETEKRLMLVSWQHLLESIAMAAGAEGKRDIQGDVQQLLGLTQRMDAQAFLPITDRDKELWGEFARRNRDYVNLVDKVVEQAVEQAKNSPWLDIKGCNKTPQFHGYGRYMRISETEAWLGVNYDLCATTSETPLWVWLSASPKPEILDALERNLRVKLYAFDLDGWDGSRKDWIPIHLETGVERNDVRDGVVRQLKAIADVINDV